MYRTDWTDGIKLNWSRVRVVLHELLVMADYMLVVVTVHTEQPDWHTTVLSSVHTLPGSWMQFSTKFVAVRRKDQPIPVNSCFTTYNKINLMLKMEQLQSKFRLKRLYKKWFSEMQDVNLQKSSPLLSISLRKMTERLSVRFFRCSRICVLVLECVHFSLFLYELCFFGTRYY